MLFSKLLPNSPGIDYRLFFRLYTEAEKLYANMAKMMVCELINEIVSKTSLTSLPVLSLDHKKQ
jgi:hypothetical protein